MDSGMIRVLGKKPGTEIVRRLGYMPQDIALVGEFTVKGAINHFGWIFGMSNKEIDDRFEFLSKLLDLPPRNQYIQDLRYDLRCITPVDTDDVKNIYAKIFDCSMDF